MKKTNLLTVATLCLALGFTSCSKDEGSVPAELCADCHAVRLWTSALGSLRFSTP